MSGMALATSGDGIERGADLPGGCSFFQIMAFAVCRNPKH
jgi:hypothetical protein